MLYQPLNIKEKKQSQLNVVKLRLSVRKITLARTAFTMLTGNCEEVQRSEKEEENIRKIWVQDGHGDICPQC